MANNELSGPVVTTFLAKWISSLEQTKFSYRIIFVPETIGAIAYLSRNLRLMKERIIAGFNVTCIGDERCYSFLPSRSGGTLSDRAAAHVLGHIDSGYSKYTWMDRGSDERQYCAPGVDLPVATVMRSKYGEYPEYHTSLDNLDFVTEKGLQGGIEVLKLVIEAIESNCYPVSTCLGEPFMSKRGLRPDTMKEFVGSRYHRTLGNFLSVADGKADLIEIADLIGIPCWEAKKVLDVLIAENLIQCAR
jgi:aminopeptidase-like protein